MTEYPLTVIRSMLLSQFPNIEFAMSTRQGGNTSAPMSFNVGYIPGDSDEQVTANIARFTEVLSLDVGELAIMEQVHGAEIANAYEAGFYPACDALITNQPRTGLTVHTADCVPIIAYAPSIQTIAVAHAGWRSTAEHISKKLADHLIEQHHAEPKEIFVYIGPAAGKDSYEIASDMAGLFSEEFLTVREGRHFLDLKGLNGQQFTDAGIPNTNIEIDKHCTIRDRSLFHSYRRDGEKAGRMMAIIYLKDSIE